MKSVLSADAGPAMVIPESEVSACSYVRRNHDIALGSAPEMFFCMQYAGHYICRKEYHIKRALQNSALLLLTLSGEGKLTYRGAEYALTRGTCMLIDASVSHEYRCAGNSWEFKYLHFWGAMSEKYIAYAGEHAGPVYMLPGDEFLRTERTLDRILGMTEEAVIRDYPGISALIYALLALLLSHDGSRSSVESAGSRAMAEAAACIRQNYMHNLSTDDIARAVSLSRSYMSEMFTRAYGIPPHEYLVLFRLSVAKDMLLNTKLSVTEIAERTGFRDVFSFSRIFRRETDLSPSRYRQKYSTHACPPASQPPRETEP